MSGDTILRIPFENLNKNGTIEVIYKPNAGPAASGFEILKDIAPDLDMCIGYPTMQAYVKDYPGSGYWRYCGWIQLISMAFYSELSSEHPDDVYYDVDVMPQMKQNGLPFFAYGYPAVIYDAPCNNFFNGAKLIWSAETYLIHMPSYVNNNTISYMAGFRWGYKESNSADGKTIDMMPIELIDRASWEKHFELFDRAYKNWRFA